MFWRRKPVSSETDEVPVTVRICTDVMPRQLLITRRGQDEIPAPLRSLNWRRLANATLSDRLLAPAASILEAQLGSEGFAVVSLIENK